MKRFKLKCEHDALFAEVVITIDDMPTYLEFVVDTGASASVLSYKNAVIMGFDMDAIPEQKSAGFFTATDKVYPKRISLESFNALGLTTEQFKIYVIDFPDDTDGVIGNDILRLLERITICYETPTQDPCIEID